MGFDDLTHDIMGRSLRGCQSLSLLRNELRFEGMAEFGPHLVVDGGGEGGNFGTEVEQSAKREPPRDRDSLTKYWLFLVILTRCYFAT